jgi:transposase
MNSSDQQIKEPVKRSLKEVDPNQMVMECIDMDGMDEMDSAGQDQPAGNADTEGGDPKTPRVQYVDRSQIIMQCVDVEALVGKGHPVRAMWELISTLDLGGFYSTIKAVEGRAGRPPVDPRVMISLWVYAYSTGEGSAREIAKLCEYHPAYRWLTGLAPINYHTISDFRIDHKEALEAIFTQILGVLAAGGWVTLDRVMQDGTKIKAFASADKFRRQERLEEYLEKAREQIRVVDEQAQEQGISKRSASARKRGARQKEERLQEAVKQLKELQADKSKEKDKENTRVSTTDPEARNMKQPDGGYAPSYNVQISTDAANKIIVGLEATQSRSDFPELINGIEKVEENMGRLPQQVVVDGGYPSRENIIAASEKGVDLIGPMANNKPQSEGLLKARGVKEEFYPQAFTYNQETDSYTCPCGKTLSYCSQEQRPTQIFHRYRASAQDCNVCPSKQSCCPKNKDEGRALMRVEEKAVVSEFIDKMKTQESKAIYKQRGPVAEFPNAWIKEKFGMRQFRLRGLTKVGTEALWAGLTYNIKQWIRLCWNPALTAAARG